MSPLHTGRTFFNTLHNISNPNQIAYKPTSQPSPAINTSFSGTAPTAKVLGHPPIEGKLNLSSQQFAYYPPNGFGRFS
jgi:hypothetical protein